MSGRLGIPARSRRHAGGELPAYVYACCVFSGAAALTYEVVWNRELLAVFGSTTWATAAVLAAFLGGMAAGSAAVARFGERVRRPLVVYIAVELTVAAYALVFGPLLAAAALPYGRFWEDLGASPGALLAGPLVIGVPLLLLPTLALGATLPLLGEALERGGHRGSGHAGRLYGYNTVGALVGAVGAGFLLLPALGMGGAAAVAMALNAAAALVALRARRLLPAPEKHQRRAGEEGDGRREMDTAGANRAGAAVPRMTGRAAGRGVLLAVVLLSSAAALGYEVVWTRILVLVVGSSTYAFSLVLGVFIGGLAAGSLWMAPRVERLRSPALVLSHLLAGVAVTALGGLFVVGRLPALFLHGFAGTGSSAALWLLQAGLAALVMFPPTLLLGAVFPVAVHLARGRDGRLGRSVGTVYAWMAAGNVVGVVFAAGALVPAFGLQGAVAALAVLSLTAGILALGIDRLPARTRGLTASAAVLACVILWGMRPGWDPVVMTSGVYRDAPRYLQLAGSPEGLERILGAYRLISYREGVESVVSVTERPTLGRERYLTLAVDGKVDASTGSDMSTQVLSGHLPVFVHPQPQSVLVVGLASGVTAGSLARHPVERIDVVEIEPAMEEAARVFRAFNGDVLSDPRVRLRFDDGRHFLAVTRASFDVIVSEPSNPWMSGPARLFTREFFGLARERLAPGGVMAQWVPLYGLDPEHFRAVIRTFQEVFPHALAFRVSDGDLLLLGGEAPLRLDLDRFAALWRDAAVQRDLRRVGVSSADELVATWAAGGPELRRLAGAGRLNTDRNGLLEFQAPKALHKNTLTENAALLETAAEPADVLAYLELGTRSPDEAARSLASLASAAAERGDEGRARALALAALKLSDVQEARYFLGHLEHRAGRDSLARQHWRAAVRDGPHGSSLLALARWELEGRDLGQAERLLSQVPPEARTREYEYLRAVALLRTGRAADVLEALSVLEAPATESIEYSPEMEATTDVFALPAAYLRAVAADRVGDPARAAVATDRFHADLRKLRSSLEREEGREHLDRLVAETESTLAAALHPEELDSLRNGLRTIVLDPLAAYYRGASLLWTGHPEEAIGAFREAGESRSEPDPRSVSRVLLAAAHLDLGRREEARRHLLQFLSARNSAQDGKVGGRDWAVAEARRLASESGAMAAGREPRSTSSNEEMKR